VAEGVYDVRISSSTGNTMFAGDYEREKFLQQVDGINTLYVAMTRASLGNHIIANLPSKTSKAAFDKMILTEFGNFGQMLYWFAERTHMDKSVDGEVISFSRGTMPDFSAYRKPTDSDVLPLVIKQGEEYPSVPLNIGEDDPLADVCERGRLKFTADALEFFKDDAEKDASRRVRGVVLHNILSRVSLPEDLEQSVQRALLEGEISSDEKDEIMGILAGAVRYGVERGWFPSDRRLVMNELSLMDVGGQEYRPDRVVLNDGKVTVIDYKFGEHHRKYERQVEKYADLWKRMGYGQVKAFLWYVDSEHVVEVL
jgi:ATP-dependent exoDNAse (exonuclease V) beta subunit